MADTRPAPFKVEWERALARRSKLPLPGIGFLMALATYASANGGSIHPSQARIADDLGVTVRTVGKWVRVGVNAGWLKEERRGVGFGDVTRPSVYSLTIPEVPGQNQKDLSGSSSVEGQNQSDPSGSDLTPDENRNGRAPEPEGSCAGTGTDVQQNRHDLSPYQRNTNPSPTQTPSEQAWSHHSDESTGEPEPAVTSKSELGHFATRHDSARSRREAAAEKPNTYRSRYTLN